MKKEDNVAYLASAIASYCTRLAWLAFPLSEEDDPADIVTGETPHFSTPSTHTQHTTPRTHTRPHQHTHTHQHAHSTAKHKTAQRLQLKSCS